MDVLAPGSMRIARALAHRRRPVSRLLLRRVLGIMVGILLWLTALEFCGPSQLTEGGLRGKRLCDMHLKRHAHVLEPRQWRPAA